MTHDSPALAEALQRVREQCLVGQDLSLGRELAVLETLGNPHHALPPVIHVAGTNGKGSTCAFVRACAEAGGLKVHADTSPHLVRTNERVRLAGSLVSDADLIDALERTMGAAAGREITYFEALAVAAFLLFADVPADLLVLEVGLGGRFDATNVVPRPAVSVITPIDYDHKEYLTDRIARIAWEKAGIAKPGAPLVTAWQYPEALGVIALEAAERGVPLYRLGVSGHVESDGPAMAYRGRRLQTGWVTPSLPGPHQHHNAALACLALETWGHEAITPAVLEAGIASAVWPARMQRLQPGPVVDRLGEGAEVWLDGGHNPHAARAIAALLGDLQARDPMPLTLVTAMVANKDRAGFFAALAPTGARVIAVPNAEGHKAATPQDLAAAARTAGLDATTAPTLEAALDMIRPAEGSPPAGRVLICGSLYLAGDVLAANGEIPA